MLEEIQPAVGGVSAPRPRRGIIKDRAVDVNAVTRGRIDFADALHQCKDSVKREKRDSPFYIGIAIDTGDRWTISPDRVNAPHCAHYDAMFQLAYGPADLIVDLEKSLILCYWGDPLMVNRCNGGGGLSREHFRAELYVFVGGDRTRERLAAEAARQRSEPRRRLHWP